MIVVKRLDSAEKLNHLLKLKKYLIFNSINSRPQFIATIALVSLTSSNYRSGLKIDKL